MNIFQKFRVKDYEVHNKRVLGDPMHTSEETKNKDFIQEAALLVEWLRVNHGIWVRLTTYAFGFQYHLDNTPDPETWNIDRRYDCADDFKTPQEAYSAAFDYILNNLI
jgi:hypothetical protein